METDPENKTPFDFFKLASFIAALAALVGFTVFIRYLMARVMVPDPQWIRLMDLFGSVEAIVFAAAGFLFGREVNRTRANSAETATRNAEIRKEEERKKAEEAKAAELEAQQQALNAENKAQMEKNKAQLFVKSLLTLDPTTGSSQVKKTSFGISSFKDIDESSSDVSTDYELKTKDDQNYIRRLSKDFYPEMFGAKNVLHTNEIISFDYAFTGATMKYIVFNNKKTTESSGRMTGVRLGPTSDMVIEVRTDDEKAWKISFSKAKGEDYRDLVATEEAKGNGSRKYYLYFKNEP